MKNPIAIKNHRTRFVVLALLSALFVGLAHGGTALAERPDIVLIMTDDMGFSDLGCYGGEIKTPNIDRLAADGLRFTEFYNCSRCWPTRASLMTGLYPEQTEPIIPMNTRNVTIAEVLGPAGYQTGMVGKWHLSKEIKPGGPIDRGFDRFYGTITGAGSFYNPLTLTRNEEEVEPDSDDYYYTDKIGDEAVKQIGDFSKSKKPFFQYIAFTAPHWPIQAPEKTVEKYLDRYKDGWEKLRKERYARMIEIGLIDAKRWKFTDPAPRVEDWETIGNKEWRIRNMAVYAAMIDHVDQAIGRVVAALKKAGRFENTLIMFVDDNGACPEHLYGDGWGTAGNVIKWAKDQGKELSMGDNMDVPSGGPFTYHSVGHNWSNASNTPLRRYKSHTHEGGSCTPFIAHWPKVITDGGQITREIGHVSDVMATCVALGEAEYPAEFKGNVIPPREGRNLMPVFQGKTRPTDHPIFFNHVGNRGIRHGKWKLVSARDKPWELYNLDLDKCETDDLVEKMPEKAAELEKIWQAWHKRVTAKPGDK